MVHEICGQNMSDLSPSLILSVTRAHALSELAGPQEIIYVRCLSDSVLGYELAVLPLDGGRGSPLIYKRTKFCL